MFPMKFMNISNKTGSVSRHLSKGTFEQDCIGSQRVSIYTNETYLEVIHKMELEKLQSALQALSSNEQVLIELYYYKDWSME